MIKFRLFIIAIFFSCNNVLFTDARKDPLRCWDDSFFLTWNDFQGKMPRQTENAAVTHVIIKMNVLTKTSIRVVNCVDVSQSWVNMSSATEHLLLHEQYHFNLAEVHARRIRKWLSSLDTLTLVSAREIYDKQMKLHRTDQNLYDLETNYSLDSEKQEEWRRKIDQQLRELEKYTESEITLSH